MSGQSMSPVRAISHYTPEQENAVRMLYGTLNRVQRPERRIFAAALAEAFMSGMEKQEQLYASTRRSPQSQRTHSAS